MDNVRYATMKKKVFRFPFLLVLCIPRSLFVGGYVASYIVRQRQRRPRSGS